MTVRLLFKGCQNLSELCWILASSSIFFWNLVKFQQDVNFCTRTGCTNLYAIVNMVYKFVHQCTNLYVSIKFSSSIVKGYPNLYSSVHKYANLYHNLSECTNLYASWLYKFVLPCNFSLNFQRKLTLIVDFSNFFEENLHACNIMCTFTLNIDNSTNNNRKVKKITCLV